MHLSHLLLVLAFNASYVRLISQYLGHLDGPSGMMQGVARLCPSEAACQEYIPLLSCMLVWVALQGVCGFLLPSWLIYQDEKKLRREFLRVLTAQSPYEFGQVSLIESHDMSIYLPTLVMLPLCVSVLGPTVAAFPGGRVPPPH